ncbi:hypothetical protein BEWA_039170 [Theileria equi strain WA]|uniref:Uncharacterized protein n=1 Tax=Theileria equi strain WA TaxID=1537102 RepID=L1LF19_THEEQ|nr:hypothetical protein BEWA_039170 [Theileria equi strain WA]EKX73879.1 hypothetical protein BEWA_039170 [Theileria equi strain WA]|eukprot:XP_004833331.1 hypothetical protein BEWA_039170 [Theileria equi strain WA]
MDITQNNSKTHKNGSYCCYKHNHTRVSVTDKTVSCKTHKQSSTSCYKHQVIPNAGKWRVAAIKYYGVNTPSKRNRVEIPGLSLLTKVSVKVTVYVLYCGHNPVLIYLESTSGGSDTTGWYKKGSDNNDNENWTQVGLDITPGDLGKIDCKDNETFQKLAKLLTKLGCYGLEECTQDTKSLQEQEQQQRTKESEELRQEVKEAEGEGSEKEKLKKKEEEGAVANALKVDGGPRQDTAVDALKTQLQDAFPWDIENILGAFAGVFTASCITIFVSWKLYKAYKHYSDPWVRPI